MQNVINSFRNEYFWLSNMTRVWVILDDVRYPSTEHAFVAGKTLIPAEREPLLALKPGEAKRYGGSKAGNLTLRPDWMQVKYDLMLNLLRQKFVNNSEFRRKLLATGDSVLIEGNTWHDNDWGDCSCGRCASTPGQNNLGRLIMQVRQELKDGKWC
jgi:ribA/ribD-fused uncharacterized protein